MVALAIQFTTSVLNTTKLQLNKVLLILDRSQEQYTTNVTGLLWIILEPFIGMKEQQTKTKSIHATIWGKCTFMQMVLIETMTDLPTIL
jgi:hypothetical protein